MVWMSASEVPGGRRGLGLMFLAKLERQHGTAWIEVPVAPLLAKEPKTCQNGAGWEKPRPKLLILLPAIRGEAATQ